MVTAVLLLVAGAILGGAVTMGLYRTTPRLVFHPDIHWAGTAQGHQRRARARWGHLIDVTITVTIVVRNEKKLNWHRLSVPVQNGNYAHLQPGDTRFLVLDTSKLSGDARTLLGAAAASRDRSLAMDHPDLLRQLIGWDDCYVLAEAVGNDAWSGGRRCWEQVYGLDGDKPMICSGAFPPGHEADRTACPQKQQLSGGRPGPEVAGQVPPPSPDDA